MIPKRPRLVTRIDLSGQFLLPGDKEEQLLKGHLLDRLWRGAIDLTAHVVPLGMRVDAEFDRFVLFAGVWSILGCHSLEIRGISRDLKTSCHLAVNLLVVSPLLTILRKSMKRTSPAALLLLALSLAWGADRAQAATLSFNATATLSFGVPSGLYPGTVVGLADFAILPGTDSVSGTGRSYTNAGLLTLDYPNSTSDSGPMSLYVEQNYTSTSGTFDFVILSLSPTPALSAIIGSGLAGTSAYSMAFYFPPATFASESFSSAVTSLTQQSVLDTTIIRTGSFTTNAFGAGVLYENVTATGIPEPTVLAMLGLCLVGWAGLRRRSDRPPSLPDARPHSDRFRCGGRESEFLQ